MTSTPTGPIDHHYGNEDETVTPAQRTRYRQIVEQEAQRLLPMKNRAKRKAELHSLKDRYNLETEVGRLQFGIEEKIMAELERITGR